MNVSDQFASSLVENAVDLARFEAGERQTLLRMFLALEAALLAELKRIDPTEPAVRAYQLARVEKLREAVRQMIRSAYRSMATRLRRDLKVLAVIEAEGIQTLAAEIVMEGLFSVLPSEATLLALVDDAVLMGRPLREWWSTQATTTWSRYADTVRGGVLRGQSLSEILRTLRGTPGARYTDGVFATSKRDLASLVSTSTQSVSQEARLQTFTENGDILRGIEFLTSMDEAVCPKCRPYSGMTYSLDHRRLPGTKLPYPGPIPLHVRCRCQWLPLIRPYRDLAHAKGPRFQASVSALAQATKDALDGRNGVDLTFGVWLKQQPPATQREILGPSRYQLFHAGKLSLQAMVNQDGKPYTLAQLVQKRRGAA